MWWNVEVKNVVARFEKGNGLYQLASAKGGEHLAKWSLRSLNPKP